MFSDETGSESGLSREQYAAIAAFRFELRRFLAFSEAAAAKAKLPPQQHQALLAIAGYAGPDPVAVGDIARQLLVTPNTAAELVSRMVEAGLLTKNPSVRDRRRMELALTPRAERLLHGLTTAHLQELSTIRTALARAIGQAERTG